MEGIINGLQYVMENYGLMAAFVVYFLGRDTWREHRLANANQKLQDEMRKVLIPLVKSTSESLATSTTVIQQNTEAQAETHEILEDVKALLQRTIQAA